LTENVKEKESFFPLRENYDSMVIGEATAEVATVSPSMKVVTVMKGITRTTNDMD
jgi:hypothetical protein